MNCVEVKNVYKSYKMNKYEESDSNRILNGINLRVESGTIYTLIGASGCGKTTLLTCLLGMQKIQSGEMKIFNKKIVHELPSSVANLIGYMPQQLALVPQLTIHETLQYFANLYFMTRETFKERFKMICELLDLPSKNFLIRDLSGGEKRRVSLAVTIIHNPKLLILDEPTVGLDFLLREKIWNFLTEMTRSQKLSVIITTHYISEAAHSHRCGFMRNGILIAEDAPNSILHKLNVETLDEAFNLLCNRNSENNNWSAIDYNDIDSNECDSEDEKVESYANPFRYQVMNALLTKEYHRVKRQPLEIWYLLILPICLLAIFLNSVGKIPNNLKIGIVNYEDNQNCLNYHLNTSISVDDCINEKFSCEFINFLNDAKMKKIFYKSEANIDDDENLFGIITILPNFTQSLLTDTSEDDYGKQIQVSLDNSKYHFFNYIYYEIINSFQSFALNLSTRCDVIGQFLIKPIKLEEAMYAPLSFDISTSILAGLIINNLYFVSILSSNFSISQSRIEGVWNRSLLAGVNISEIILASFIQSVLIAIVITAEMLFGIYIIYSIKIVGNVWMIILFSMSTSIISFMLGFLISILAERFFLSCGIIMFLNFSSFMICGLFWPIEAIPSYLKPISYSYPLTFSTIALRNIMLKGFDFSHSFVIHGLIYIAVASILLLILSFIGLKKKKFSRQMN